MLDGSVKKIELEIDKTFRYSRLAHERSSGFGTWTKVIELYAWMPMTSPTVRIRRRRGEEEILCACFVRGHPIVRLPHTCDLFNCSIPVSTSSWIVTDSYVGDVTTMPVFKGCENSFYIFYLRQDLHELINRNGN